MNATLTPNIGLTLPAHTIADLMSLGPVSLRESATVVEAMGCLIDRGISGAPVIDEAGRPIGVLTESDLIVHAREQFAGASRAEDRTRVRDLMTPAVFTVRPDAPAVTVIEHMRSLNVHRIFVVDGDGILVGVVTALDVLRRLELPKGVSTG
jgi:CBS domain-containing protein